MAQRGWFVADETEKPERLNNARIMRTLPLFVAGAVSLVQPERRNNDR